MPDLKGEHTDRDDGLPLNIDAGNGWTQAKYSQPPPGGPPIIRMEFRGERSEVHSSGE